MRRLWPLMLLLSCQPIQSVGPDPKYALVRYLGSIHQLPQMEAKVNQFTNQTKAKAIDAARGIPGAQVWRSGRYYWASVVPPHPDSVAVETIMSGHISATDISRNDEVERSGR